MEINNINDCYKLRLLRNIHPDKDKSKKSLEIAKKRLKEAKLTLQFGEKLGFFNTTIIESYTAMFHAARAILYIDGVQEKSHYAVFLYLKEKHSNSIPLPIINLLNVYRTERHEALYGLDYELKQDEAQQAVKDAEEFIKEIEKFYVNQKLYN